MSTRGKNDEYLRIKEIDKTNYHSLENRHSDLLSILWFRDNGNLIKVDGTEYSFSANQIVFITMFHQIEVKETGRAILIQFNKQFHCLSQPDAETSCNGILFFGSSIVPSIAVPQQEIIKFELLLSVFIAEMNVGDGLQIEMLDILLKRFLILSTRIFKEQSELAAIEVKQTIDVKPTGLIREFNYLVECHYSEKHTVAEYAKILNKSPKTLSNFFLKYFRKTPLQIIRERIALEARNQLRNTERTVSEIAYQIGFQDVQTFSRFFKCMEGVSPKGYRINQN